MDARQFADPVNRAVAGIDVISTRTASNLVGVYYHEAEHPNEPFDPSFDPSDGCKHLGDEIRRRS